MKKPMTLKYFLATGTLALAATLAHADYPDHPVKIIVGAAAGGAADILARGYAEQLKERIGQPVIVDNKPGATGGIGANALAKSPADGYSIGLNSSAMVINPWLVKQPFDVMKDLVPVARAAETPYVVMVSAKLPVKNLDDFVAYAKANPGKLDCATYGVGSPPHLALEMFKQAAGIEVLHVPYKTFAQSLPDLISGQIDCSIDLPTVPLPHVKSGQLRAIAHTGHGRMALYPEAEPFGQRFGSATVTGWQAIFAPAATPRPVLERLRTEWVALLGHPDVQKLIRESGYLPSNGTVDAFAKEMAADYERFGRIVKETGMRLN